MPFSHNIISQEKQCHRDLSYISQQARQIAMGGETTFGERAKPSLHLHPLLWSSLHQRCSIGCGVPTGQGTCRVGMQAGRQPLVEICAPIETNKLSFDHKRDESRGKMIVRRWGWIEWEWIWERWSVVIYLCEWVSDERCAHHLARCNEWMWCAVTGT